MTKNKASADFSPNFWTCGQNCSQNIKNQIEIQNINIQLLLNFKNPENLFRG
jgi:hypothetical protein